MSSDPQTTCENDLSTDQINGLITEMNAILHNEFYLSLRHNKTCHFDAI